MTYDPEEEQDESLGPEHPQVAISLLAVLSGRRFSASRIRRDGAKGAIVHLTREDPKRQRLERRQDKTQLSEICKL